jgi:hypothetical protein
MLRNSECSRFDVSRWVYFHSKLKEQAAGVEEARRRVAKRLVSRSKGGRYNEQFQY